MSKIGIVIKREYLTRVRKKSFIVLTFLMPVLLRCYRKQAFICFGGAFVAVWFLTGPITAILGWSANEPREALSVPAQQIAFWRS